MPRRDCSTLHGVNTDFFLRKKQNKDDLKPSSNTHSA